MQAKLLKKNLGFKFFLLSLFAVFLFLYLPLYLRWRRFREENKKLLKRIESLEGEVVKLENDLKNLQKNSYLLEKLARDKLGLIKEGEIVVDIKE